MYVCLRSVVAGALSMALAGTGLASDFNVYGDAPAVFEPVTPTPDLIFELGLGLGTAPVYEGATQYGLTYTPIFALERLNIPGVIEIGGGEEQGGFGFAPSLSLVPARISADHRALAGLNDIATTYALGARVGYEMVFNATVSAEIYGAARWAFGGAEGFIGEAGIDVTGRLTPQWEIVGGPVVNFASENYMDTYFGVTNAESLATGGRMPAYDPSGGIKSVGAKLGTRYEFIDDTFLHLNASYASYVGDALASPIVQTGSRHQFTAGIGLSRRFAF